MFEIRTDLASELAENDKENNYVSSSEILDGVNVTSVTLARDDEQNGKRAGRYLTAEVGRVWDMDRASFERAAGVVAKLIIKLMPPTPKGGGCVLAAGLGNSSITSDAVGPRAVSKMLVTRHIKQSDPPLFSNAGFGCLAAFAPGVLGQTGVESGDLIRGAVRACSAHCVIVIDALAARRLTRVGTTVQLTDTGISPGSGVYNRRSGIDERSLGVPVIAIGVPTVVDAATLAFDLLGISGAEVTPQTESLLAGAGSKMFVSPKECDVMAEKLSRFIADSVNLAVHRGLTTAEMQEYTA